MAPLRQLFWEDEGEYSAEAVFGPFVVEEAAVRQFEALVGSEQAASDGVVQVPELMLQSLVAGLAGEHQGYLETSALRGEVCTHDGSLCANEPFRVRTRTTRGEAIDELRGAVRHDRAVLASDGRVLLSVVARALVRRSPSGGG